MNYDNNLYLDNNLYPDMQNINESKFSIKIILLTAISIFIVVLIIWFYYAIQYRYSSERIADKLRKKYKVEIDDKTRTLLSSGGKINALGTHASTIIIIKNKDMEGNDVISKLFTLPIRDCSPADYNCVEL